MIEWFEALSVAGKVFVCVAIPSTLILVIQTVMTFFGFGDGGDGTDMPDLDGDGVPDGIFGSNDAGETDNFEVAESSGLHMFSLAIQEHITIDKLKLLDIFFLPHFNQPYNYITMAALGAE